MKVKEESYGEIVEKYLSGTKASQLASDYGVSYATINRIVKKKAGRQRTRLTKKECVNIENDWISGLDKKSIAKKYSLGILVISGFLLRRGLREKSPYGKHKGGFTQEEKARVIDLYTCQHRGKSYIGGLFNRSDGCISYWLKKWQVPNIPRSQISTTIRQVYGPTRGFSGRRHSLKSKNKTADAMKKLWLEGKVKVVGPKSRTYNTIIGKVLGKYEVAYVQKCYEEGNLPEVCRKRYKTPFGTYMPDFCRNGRFVEVKSEFTLRVAKGQYHTAKGKYSNAQWNKICYFKDNIAELDVIVMKERKVQQLFSRASNVLLD